MIKRNSSIFEFMALVIILGIPFWVLGGITGIQLLPGLPIDAFMVVCPALAALIITNKDDGKPGVINLLKRGLDYKNVFPKSWYLVAIFLMPLVSVIVFLWYRLLGEMVPVPNFSVFQLLIFVLIFFIAALCEEIGWSGYLTDRIQNHIGALNTGIIIGLFSVAYHLIALIQAQRSLGWIMWWSIGTIAGRVIIVWLFNNTRKSIFTVSLFHMTINVTWQLFPINGSYYSPFKTSIVLIIVLMFLIALFKPRTLTRQIT